MRIRMIGVAAALASSWACGEVPPTAQTPTSPAAPSVRPDFMNGPASLPNVVRFSGGAFGLGIQDPVSGLAVYLDWPCPGQGVPVDYQQVGQLSDALHELAMQTVPVLVYRGPHSVCVSPPLASGTGKLMLLDSDYYQTGNGAKFFSLRLNGQVDLATGGHALLTVQSIFVTRDGTQYSLVDYIGLGPRS